MGSTEEQPAQSVSMTPRGFWGRLQSKPFTMGMVVAVVGLTAATVVLAVTTAVNYSNAVGWESYSAEMQKLNTDLEQQVGTYKPAYDARGEMEKRESDVAAREVAVTSREGDLKAREDAVAVVEQRIQASSMKDGVYTVGVSVEPGTYRTDSSSTRCYWAIYTSGTNYEDIVQNDVGSVGVLTVTLSPGQDFKTTDCGTWAKAG